jgi:DNA helicase-2/ATP-dependent DNA helicase PcrA
MKYTKEQESVLNTLEGNLRILACAGSGKTEVISRRIANVIKNGVAPENIVCFTFTNKAADEMRSRVQKHINELCPEILTGPLFVGTIHSFCFKILKEFNHKFDNFDILTENSRIAFISNPDNYHRIGLDVEDGHPSKFKKISRFCESVDVFREELLQIEKVKSFAKTKEEKLFPFRYGKYIDLLDGKRFIDFSGILYECYNMLNDPEVLSQIKKRYRYLVCDEYQDVNRIQELIIEKIWGSSNNISVVGDDDQAIYHWRGTKLTYLLDFPKRYKEAKSYPLLKNFRTSMRISSIANKVIEQNKRITKPMFSERPDEDNCVLINEFEGETDEARFIARKIKDMLGKQFTLPNNSNKRISYDDFAILFRSVKNSSGAVIDELRKQGIPFRVRGGISDLFECREVDFVAKCFAYLSDLEYRNQRHSLEGLFKAFQDLVPRKDLQDSFKPQIVALKNKLVVSARTDLQRTYHKILAIIGVQKGTYADSVLMLFGQLSQLVKEFEDISYPLSYKDLKFFLGFVEGYAMDEYNSDSQTMNEKSDAVTISTIHRAKGLEFGFVFVPMVNKGILPTSNRKNPIMLPKESYDFDAYQGTVEDERRLFYVAVTRAIGFVSVSCIKSKNGKKMEPSDFFEEFKYSLNKTQHTPKISAAKLIGATRGIGKIVLSPSDIAYYLACPYRYKLGNVFQFNPGIDPAIGYGKQVHSIIEYLFKSSNKSKPDRKHVATIVDRDFFLRFAFGKTFGNLKNKAKMIVGNYVDKYGNDFERYLSSEKEFYMTFDEFDYKGIADLLLATNGKKIEIIDFKTRTGEIKDFELQMHSYALGISSSYGFEVESASVHFLTTNERKMVNISPRLTEKTKKTISKVAKAIETMCFPYSNDAAKCNKCDFKVFCSGRIVV